MPEAGTFVLPPTASRASLLDGGSDRRFRTLVSDLLTISARMEMARTHLGRKLGITGPQYSLIVAIAHLQGSQGLSVGALAEALHVSSAFVASETNKLVRRNFLLKRTNPDDRRGVLLSIAPAGRLKLDRISEEIRWINDHFFGGLDAKAFDAMCLGAAKLVQGSNAVIHALREPAKDQSTQRVAG
jgi:MarR family transcriptional regulator, organic hydroperoxide resistance regulator